MIRIIKVMIITNLTRQMSIIFAAPYWYNLHSHNWGNSKASRASQRSRPGASPFISALTVAVYPAIALMCGHNFGTFCPQVGGMDERRERPYTPCLLMKTALRLRLPAPQAQPVFLPLQMPLPSPAATAFETATPTERITHYTLLRKVVCQKGALPPFGNPGQQNRLNISHFPGA